MLTRFEPWVVASDPSGIAEFLYGLVTCFLVGAGVVSGMVALGGARIWFVKLRKSQRTGAAMLIASAIGLFVGVLMFLMIFFACAALGMGY